MSSNYDIIYKTLTECSNRKKLITYSELIEHVNYVSGIEMSLNELFLTLDSIDEDTLENHGVPISAIVVRKDIKMPGKGFFCRTNIKNFIYNKLKSKDIFKKKNYRDMLRMVFEVYW